MTWAPCPHGVRTRGKKKDLIGCVRSESSSCAGIGMLLFTEAHLEFNAGLVISIGNRSKHSPLEYDTTASTLAKNLQAGRLALVSRARPPVNPSDTAIGGTLYPLCWNSNANRP